ncbi:MAG: DUF2130 domain-containing protein [Solirubrobacterales bacterium]
MEAAQHFTQTEMETGATVRAIGDRLVIEQLVIEDERAAQLVRDRSEAGRDPSDTVRDAVEIGARVLEREGMASEVDYVRGEFERTAGQVRELFVTQAREVNDRLDEALSKAFDAEGGSLVTALDSHADALTDELTRAFGEESSGAVQHKIREHVAKTLEERNRDLVRHLSSEDGANPLADFKSAVVRQVTETSRQTDQRMQAVLKEQAELKEQLARLTEHEEGQRQVAAAEEAGTRKGLDFEGRVHEALETIADGRGDCALHTGAETVAGGGKKGDSVVEIGAAEGQAQARIVFEAKDRTLSRNQAFKELSEAMAQRHADYGILVVAGDEHVPARTEALTEYEGTKLIVAVDRDEPGGIALEAAYRLARARVLMARDRSLDVDAAGVRDQSEAAVTALRQAQTIKRALTEATKSVEGARSGLESMVADVQARLERIDELVAAADAAADASDAQPS